MQLQSEELSFNPADSDIFDHQPPKNKNKEKEQTSRRLFVNQESAAEHVDSDKAKKRKRKDRSHDVVESTNNEFWVKNKAHDYEAREARRAKKKARNSGAYYGAEQDDDQLAWSGFKASDQAHRGFSRNSEFENSTLYECPISTPYSGYGASEASQRLQSNERPQQARNFLFIPAKGQYYPTALAEAADTSTDIEHLEQAKNIDETPGRKKGRLSSIYTIPRPTQDDLLQTITKSRILPVEGKPSPRPRSSLRLQY